MNVPRLKWEPETCCDKGLVAAQVLKYMDGEATFAQFSNDTCLMLKPLPNLAETIEGAMREARKFAEFRVYRMDDGDFLVFFASPLIVYVGKEEFASRETEIRRRTSELYFPSETLIPVADGSDDMDLLVGLYARGKLQHDAWQSLTYHIVGRPMCS